MARGKHLEESVLEALKFQDSGLDSEVIGMEYGKSKRQNRYLNINYIYTKISFLYLLISSFCNFFQKLVNNVSSISILPSLIRTKMLLKKLLELSLVRDMSDKIWSEITLSITELINIVWIVIVDKYGDLLFLPLYSYKSTIEGTGNNT